MALANCKLCNRLFNKYMNDTCPSCIEEQEAKLFAARAALKKSQPDGGISIEHLAHKVQLTEELVYEMYHNGMLGTHAGLLLLECPRCQATCKASELENGFCADCFREIKESLGSEVKSAEELDEAFRKERERLATEQTLSKKHYGLKKRVTQDYGQFYKF